MKATKSTVDNFKPFDLIISVETVEEASILARFFNLTITIPRACETKKEFTNDEISFITGWMKQVSGVMESE